jgi:hypothetical protein
MSSVIRTVALCGALAGMACGAASRPPDTVSTVPSGPAQTNPSTPGVLPVGQELDVRLQSTLSSESATVEQRFEATTVVDLVQDGRVLVPAGSIARGVVADVKRPGRIERTGSLTLSFDEIVVRGREQSMRALATRVFESGGIRDEAGTAGAGAGVGGVVGGIVGGLRGAIVGAVIGAGGAIAATEGQDVRLPAGAIIRIRLDTPVDLG